jgi:rubrerythrin
MIRFNADEVFEMALQIERNGAKFYNTVAAKTAEPKVAALCRKLAEMEVQHGKMFEKMRTQLGGSETQPTTFDPEGETAMYLQAFADGKVFDVHVDPSAKLTGRESSQQVLQTAIGLEKDSIVFYVGIKRMVPEGFGKDRLDAIIGEEMGHIRLLSDLAGTV